MREHNTSHFAQVLYSQLVDVSSYSSSLLPSWGSHRTTTTKSGYKFLPQIALMSWFFICGPSLEVSRSLSHIQHTWCQCWSLFSNPGPPLSLVFSCSLGYFRFRHSFFTIFTKPRVLTSVLFDTSFVLNCNLHNFWFAAVYCFHCWLQTWVTAQVSLTHSWHDPLCTVVHGTQVQPVILIYQSWCVFMLPQVSVWWNDNKKTKGYQTIYLIIYNYFFYICTFVAFWVEDSGTFRFFWVMNEWVFLTPEKWLIHICI